MIPSAFESLPNELLLHIFSSLDVSTVSTLGSVSRTLHRLTRDNIFWYQRFCIFFPKINKSRPYSSKIAYFKAFTDTFNKTYAHFTQKEKKFICYAWSQAHEQILKLNFTSEETLDLIKKWMRFDLANFRRLPQPLLNFLYETCCAQLPLNPEQPFHDATHLAWAIIFNQRTLIHDWLERLKIDFSFPCISDEALPALLATRLNRVEIVQDFLDHRLELCTTSRSEACSKLLLHQAAAADSVEVAKLLIQTEPRLVKLEDKTGAIPLHIASAKGSLEVMEILIDLAPETINKLTAREESPLGLAALNNQAEAISVLSAKGADIDQPERQHRTPLLIAIDSDSLDAAERLIERGANPNIADAERGTALERALMHHRDLLARKLLAHGAITTRKAARLTLWNQQHQRKQAVTKESTTPQARL